MMLVENADVMHHLTDDILPAVFRNNAEGQWQDIGSGSIIAIIDRVRIERMSRTGRRASLDGQELLIEGLRHLLCCRTPLVGFTILKYHFRPCGHQFHDVNHVGR